MTLSVAILVWYARVSGFNLRGRQLYICLLYKIFPYVLDVVMLQYDEKCIKYDMLVSMSRLTGMFIVLN